MITKYCKYFRDFLRSPDFYVKAFLHFASLNYFSYRTHIKHNSFENNLIRIHRTQFRTELKQKIRIEFIELKIEQIVYFKIPTLLIIVQN